MAKNHQKHTHHINNALDKGLKKLSDLPKTYQIKYVQMMFYIIAHGLASASRHDKLIRRELQGYPEGLTIKMQVLPQHASFVVQVSQENGKPVLDVVTQDKADVKSNVTVYFKHLQVAMLVLSFQESTPQAFANDRMIVDGDIGFATRFVRILNQLQALILPKLIAQRAIKRYPQLGLSAKLSSASRVYLALAKSLIHKN